jgi:hypothetical protein
MLHTTTTNTSSLYICSFLLVYMLKEDILKNITTTVVDSSNFLNIKLSIMRTKY